jgi:hypothetical protein
MKVFIKLILLIDIFLIILFYFTLFYFILFYFILFYTETQIHTHTLYTSGNTKVLFKSISANVKGPT